MDRKFMYLSDAEYMASKIIRQGQAYVDEAIAHLGRVIDNSNCPKTIKACEKLVEILNEGPNNKTINQLSEDQSKFAASMLSAVYTCVTLSV